MNTHKVPSAQQPVAIIGMACRFPGANNYEEFWQNLMEGRSGISEIPKERWDWKQYQHDFPKNGATGKWGGFIKDADCFDASFFQLSGKEAELMDPQQRIMLELAWSCMEDAGIPPSRLSGTNTGVFTGVFNFDYKELAERGSAIAAHYGTGTSTAVVANRLSYYFNLKGPSVPIDTACSSSLQAIHMAAQSIQLGECDLALAGGVSLLLTPAKHIAFAKAGMLSPTGSCKSFDESADGYIRGEGAGLLLLKSLEQAKADGDIIYGVLRGSAANHCGRTYTITYPSPTAQAEVIATAVKRAGIEPQSISYIEAHGTGTPKGDPIEFEGLTQAMQNLNVAVANSYCGVGSVKANIGHLESAAGVAGMIKVLLAMKHRQLPGLLHFRQLNHRITLNDTPFYIVDKHRDWTSILDENGKAYPRRAGVSSFGFGGTNAHVVLEEAPVKDRRVSAEQPRYLICLSAKNKEALQENISELVDWLETSGQGVDLADISYTLLFGRDHFQVRKAFVVKDLSDLRAALRDASTPFSVAGRLLQLAERYMAGHNDDWNSLFPDGANRISMPTYSFQRTRYWLQEDKMPSYLTRLPEEEHDRSDKPPVWVFDGNECFLKDHVFNGQKILPAVVYMEFVRSHVQYLLQQQLKEDDIICLKNQVWMAPFIADRDGIALQISLEHKENGHLSYEVFSEDAVQRKTVHSCGTACVMKVDEMPAHKVGLIADGTQTSFDGKQFYGLLRDAGFNYGPSHQMINQLFVDKDKIVARLKTSGSETETAAFVLHPGYMDAALQATMGWLAEEAAEGAAIKIPLPFTLQELKVFSSCKNAAWIIVTKNSKDQSGQTVNIDLCDASGKVCVQLLGYCGRTVVNKVAETIGISVTEDVHQLESFWMEKQSLDDEDSIQFENHVAILCGVSMSSGVDIDHRWQNIRCHLFETDAIDVAGMFTDYCWKILEFVQELSATTRGKLLLQVVVANDGDGRLLAGLTGLLRTVSAEYTKFHTQIVEWSKAETSDLFETLMGNKAQAADRHVRYEDGKRLVKSWQYAEEKTMVPNPWRTNGVYLITGGIGGLGLVFTEEIFRRTSRATIILVGRSPLSPEHETQLRALQTKGNIVVYRQLDVTSATKVQETIGWIKSSFGNLHGILHAAGIINDNYIIRKTRDELEKVLAPKVSGLINLDNASAGMNLDLFVLFSSTSGALGNIGQSDYSAANCFMDEYARYRNGLRAQGLRSGKAISISWPFWKEGGMRISDAGVAALYRYSGMVPLETQKGIQAFYNLLQSSQDHVLVMQGDITLLSNRLQCNLVKRTAIALNTHESLNESKMNHQENKQAQELIQQLICMAADILKSSAADIDPKAPLEEYGFDSILYTEFAVNLNETFKTDIGPTLFFQQSTIAALADYLRAESTTIPAAVSSVSVNQSSDDKDKLRQLTAVLCGYAAEILEVPVADIDPAVGMDEYSFDSIGYTSFTIKMNDAFGLQLAPTLFFEYATLKALAEHLLDRWPACFEGELSTYDGQRESTQGPLKMGAPSIVEAQGPAMAADKDSAEAAIAIIGVSGSFAMSEDIEELWKNLIGEKDCITEIPADRWDWESHYGNAVSEKGKTNVKWGGFLKDLNAFDASFFNISPGEAAYIDPQQRLLLMHVWKALEDAGYAPQDFYGSNTALFTGITSHEYSARVSRINVKTEGYHQASIISCIGPNRVSYFLNLHGTSEPVDTACSSALVAIHRAVREIRSGDSELAIAGGVTVLSSLPSYISFDKAGMLSKTGRSRTFSDQADGYARGEGIGIILLKRLDAAERDGDHIYGVIKGTGVNHGGRANSLQAPNMRAQAALLKTVYSKAGIDPRTVGYVEAHGTGTKIGDPIEIDALKAAFKELYSETGSEEVKSVHCGIGSLKTNIGHSEYAAGIAGVIKVLLQIKHQTLVKTLHCETMNPYIDIKNSPFYIVRETQAWQSLRDAHGKALPRRAGVSSFGFGGVNAHVILEEYVDKRPVMETSDDCLKLFVLSAKKPEQLKVQVQQLLKAIRLNVFTNSDFASIAYTLQVGRNAMEERLCILAKDFKELENRLERFLINGKQEDWTYIGQVKKIKPGSNTANTTAIGEQIAECIRTGDYKSLAQLWIEGYTITWSQLYKNENPRRLSLPTYPFAKEVFKLDAEYTLTEKVAAPFLPLMRVAEPVVEMPPNSEIQHILVANIARLLNMKATHISFDESLEEYGFDSVLYTQFSIELNEQFGLDLTPAVFFRYPNIGQLSVYLADEYPLAFNRSRQDSATQEVVEKSVVNIVESATYLNRLIGILTGKVAQILKFSEDLIDPAADLNEYGLDSIIVTQLTSELNEEFGFELTPNIIFGCQNLQSLGSYIQENYRDFFSHAPCDMPIEISKNEVAEESQHHPAPAVLEEKKNSEGVAVIGLSIQFPMAKDANQFWDNLVNEKHCISEIPADRWDWRDYPELKVKWGGFMDDMASFDPLFFKISPAEALQMEPQQRLLMQHAWKAIEDAGYNPHSLSGTNTGVFAGILCYEYSKLLAKANVPIASHSLMGMVGSMGPNRISYFLDIHGPSEAIETACSSSLVAIHRAAEAIVSGTCDMALAGGVNTLLSPDVFMSLHEAGTLSPDGVCRPFSDQAKGYVRGEGVGVVFLKRLEDAERDGDHIYGVIRGTAENHGGRANTLTSPNPKAQAALLETAYVNAGVDPRRVGYIETHGTGTELGDPIEVNALKKAFGKLYDDKGLMFAGEKHCGIGSVKSNIGHLEVAAGIAGVAKVLLQMKHKKLIKSLHTERLNPYIDFNDGPFFVVKETAEWKAIRDEAGKELPRCAGVSSFGFGGVSAHIVLEEYVPKVSKGASEAPRSIVVLSAKNKELLHEYAQSLRSAIENKQVENEDLASLAYTLQIGREAMEERFAVVVDSLPQLWAALNEFICGGSFNRIWFQGNIKQKAETTTVNVSDPLAKMAMEWITGGRVDWMGLYGKQKPVRMSLPTYPFERKKYWPADVKRSGTSDTAPDVAFVPANEGDLNTRAIAFFKNTISQLVNIPAREIQETELLIHYGVDSIAISRLLVKMRSVMPKLTNSVVFEHPTIAELVDYLVRNENTGLQQLLGVQTERKTDHYFSGNSLLLLNDASQGRPVFWFHPGGGSIDGYQYFAAVSERPFYGVVADQWIREGRNIQGIPEMAATYLRMIQSVQPEGPYDLGGFSLGGALAYEIARQLQVQGQRVATITMIDSVYVPEMMGKFLLDYKTMLLQTVNLLLMTQTPASSIGQTSGLIHRSELDVNLSDKAFLDLIMQQARQRGFTYPTAYVEAIVAKGLKVRDASGFTDYKVLPLIDPAGIHCTYFVNETQSFYGDLSSYFILNEKDNVLIEQIVYWDAWRKQLAHFEKIAIPATDHVTLMNDHSTLKLVIDHCKTQYAFSFQV
ncbi:SDR family NAD(P)-dependent oxidoreductase [Taibaiella soli]|nr:SDR family NAD(P)-dependent oxidoreductase [Taibaiella soli]